MVEERNYFPSVIGHFSFAIAYGCPGTSMTNGK